MHLVPVYSRNLRFLREIRGDTQQDVADYLNKVSKATVGGYEKGRTDLSGADLMKLADYFGVSETELLRKDLWRMSDEEIAALKTRWGEAAETKVLENV
jgi:transcriptional regulator with XRE-family HTH domain